MNVYEGEHIWLVAFLVYGCFIAFSASVIFRLYVRHCLLKSLLKKSSTSPDMEALYLRDLKYLFSAWRDRWLLTIGTNLLLRHRHINIGSLDRFDIFKLPARLRGVAVANAICVYGGFIWMVAAATGLKLML